ncbi:MAG: GspE/PulE family protein [Proteobacteria bacterium]|nr:GspE/PulE family protein [Pseudomonadota bacterium]MBU4259317.1 GspE/PulE family protein [Pseudomonadota bacterium]MBU4286878.1 GspE/PulE family protein [Pseudomonadota bacterium]MCG2759124.1 GspE/PulE family protein [Desulfobacteraceae bacterium]
MVNPLQERSKVISIKVLDRLKQAMVNEGLVTREKLRIAEIAAQRKNETLSKTLIKLGFVTEEELVSFIGDKMHIPYVNIKSYTIDRKVLDLIPEKIARRYNIIPLFKIEDVLTIAMSDPLDIISIDDISKVAQLKAEAVMASGESIKVAIDQWYGMGEARKELIEELADELKEKEKEKEPQYADEIAEIHLKKEASEPPIVKLVNSYIAQAMLEGASDIHLEPKRGFMAVRFRIDGFLYNRHRLPMKLTAPITSRIKIMSGLDISKKKIPQDGRIGIVIRDKSVDIRTSTFPSMYGENVVLRVLDKTRGIPTLSELGFFDEDLKIFKEMIKTTRGIILSTGPTGSGKTTTIYSTINTLNKTDKNIMTIEDPIEYEIEDVVASQVDPKAGVTFATALRSILRQDPDIIYVGEIRDLETAEISVRAALTGHLVLSTLHTNDAVGSVTRLSDIGVETSLIASVLNCAFAQRLVRRICTRCSNAYQPDESLLKKLRLPLDTKFYKGQGCEFCAGIGYKGRVGLFEILVIDRDIRRLIAKQAPEAEIMQTARAKGMKTLLQDGLQKVRKGITTLEEVKRVTRE